MTVTTIILVVVIAFVLTEITRRAMILCAKVRCTAVRKLLKEKDSIEDLLILRDCVRDWKINAFLWNPYVEYRELQREIDNLILNKKYPIMFPPIFHKA